MKKLCEWIVLGLLNQMNSVLTNGNNFFNKNITDTYILTI